jgi:hypothetical protein
MGGIRTAAAIAVKGGNRTDMDDVIAFKRYGLGSIPIHLLVSKNIASRYRNAGNKYAPT